MRFPNRVGKNVGGVYQIRNLVNGKVYIGSTLDLLRRFYEHGSHLRNNKHHNTHLQRAWNKYGSKNFIFEVLKVINDIDLLSKMEVKLIDSHNKNNTYNMDTAPLYTQQRSKESRKKMSESQNKTAVYQICPNTRNVIKRYNSIIEAEKEVIGGTQGNISRLCSNGGGYSHGSLWIYADEYDNGGCVSWSPHKNPVVQISLKTGEYVKTFESVYAAHCETGIGGSSITYVCRNIYGSAGGYVWTWEDDYDPDINYIYRYKQYIENSKILIGKRSRKPVYKMTLEGKILKKFDSIKDAAASVNTPAAYLSSVCKSKKKITKGFRWEYA